MRIIICGSRDYDYDDHELMTRIIMSYKYTRPTFVHGGARGADRLAGFIASSHGFEVEEHPADWKGQGRVAGPIRNRLMLDLGADLVLAFKDNFDWSFSRGGAENMVRIAKEANVPAYVIQRA